MHAKSHEMKVNMKCIIAGLSLAFIGILMSDTYRPYIYQNRIYDFHLADTIGNIVAVPAYALVYCGFSSKYSFNKIIVLSVVGFIFYEILSTVSFHGVFDIYDIIATALSGATTFCIYEVYKKAK